VDPRGEVALELKPAMASIATAHGPLELPAFLPDATRGVVRAVEATQLAAVGVQGLCVNAWHLARAPGTRALSRLGGIHRFMGFDGPVLADSGGFQILSMIESGALRGAATPKGLRYREKGGEAKLLGPQKCIRWQLELGADLLVCLDHCTHPDAPIEKQRESVENTVRWARECKLARDRFAQSAGRAPSLFAVIQGGRDANLRRECAARLVEIGFDGYAYGGWPVRDDGLLVESVALVGELAPRDKPLWGLGIGKPENLVAAARLRYELFDCVLPTRDARHARLYVRGAGPLAPTNESAWYSHLYIGDKKHAASDAPIDANCRCPCCERYSRGYLHHLWNLRDSVAARMLTLHNLSFYSGIVRELRAG